MSTLRDRLAHLLREGGPPLEPLRGRELVIYGAGNCGRSTAALARSRGFEIKAFLDQRGSSDRTIDGVPCYRPDSRAAEELAATSIPIGVAIFNYATDMQPIISSLQKSGYELVLSFYELHELLQAEPQFWLTGREFYRDAATEILAGFDLFADEQSQQIYHDCIALRLTYDVRLLRNPDQANQYFPLDLPLPRMPLRLIDGGAFVGDTVRMVLGKGLPIAALAAFEPDAENFARLSDTIREERDRLGDAALFQRGLGKETSLGRFTQGQGGGSSLDSRGETVVEVVALDEVLPDFAPTFIKLDIEGAEPDALRGAAQLITQFQPTLAVCVYHAPAHLWEIPLLMRDLVPRCGLALRYHQFNGFDVVAYAIFDEE